jgi:capsular polysaccharide biosynthesis protein
VFLSRSEFHGQWEEGNKHIRSAPEWDRVLDQRFHDAGFAVVAPERLPVTDQIRLIAGADVLAGQAGSALHLSGIAPPGARVLELGDSRSPVTPSRTQLMIDAASDHLTAFVPYLDLQSLDRTLDDLPDDTLTQAPATPGDD